MLPPMFGPMGGTHVAAHAHNQIVSAGSNQDAVHDCRTHHAWARTGAGPGVGGQGGAGGLAGKDPSRPAGTRAARSSERGRPPRMGRHNRQVSWTPFR
jgi:hypothetical protein